MKASALVRHPLSIAGAAIATASAAVFIALLIAGLAGMFENPYAGLVVFVLVPAVFVVGLLLIPIGVRLQRRKSAGADVWHVIDFRLARVPGITLAFAPLLPRTIVVLL